MTNIVYQEGVSPPVGDGYVFTMYGDLLGFSTDVFIQDLQKVPEAWRSLTWVTSSKVFATQLLRAGFKVAIRQSDPFNLYIDELEPDELNVRHFCDPRNLHLSPEAENLRWVVYADNEWKWKKPELLHVQELLTQDIPEAYLIGGALKQWVDATNAYNDLDIVIGSVKAIEEFQKFGYILSKTCSQGSISYYQLRHPFVYYPHIHAILPENLDPIKYISKAQYRCDRAYLELGIMDVVETQSGAIDDIRLRHLVLCRDHDYRSDRALFELTQKYERKGWKHV